MQLKFNILIVFCLLLCLSMKGQQKDTTSFHYQRMYQRLQAKGFTSQEIKKQIAIADSLYFMEKNRQIEEQIADFSLTDSIQYTTNSVCEDIPVEQKAVLLDLYNSLNLSAWATGWDFSQPVISWNQSTGTGWKGITVTGCNVTTINISYNAIGLNNCFIPDLTNLTELRTLFISPTNGGHPLTTGGYLINSNSNFSSIGNLTKLEFLFINNANFDGALPSSFSNLSPTIRSLTLLNCNLNAVSQLDSIISTYTELRVLKLDVNFNITQFPLPPSFIYLTNLSNISFSRSKISNIDVISNLINLIIIDFSRNNINQLFPNLSNNVHLLNNNSGLFDIDLAYNEIYGTIPAYFENKNVRIFSINNNNLSGAIPTLNFNNYPVSKLFISNNNFRFNDFEADFDTYLTHPSLPSAKFWYGLQAKINEELNWTKTIGQQVTMSMFSSSDTNFHPLDTYQWKKDGASILGANSKTYTFIAQPDSGGVYTCESYHLTPHMTTDPLQPQGVKNLILYRNKISLNVVATPPPCVNCTSFDLLLGEKYIISGWVKEAQSTGVTQNNAFTYQNSAIAVSFTDVNGNLINSTQSFVPTGAIIDGWQQIRGEFIVPTNVDDINIELVNNNTQLNAFFDDIRVHPFNGNLKSFVYDQATQKLMAELDENNYATFYEYDNEGGLVRVKKETERGVYTIQETRSSTTKKTN